MPSGNKKRKKGESSSNSPPVFAYVTAIFLLGAAFGVACGQIFSTGGLVFDNNYFTNNNVSCKCDDTSKTAAAAAAAAVADSLIPQKTITFLSPKKSMMQATAIATGGITYMSSMDNEKEC